MKGYISMDAETIRLVVTTVGVIVAALGGAGMTALSNTKNLRATQSEAKAQWLREQDEEHRRWLRENKKEAYVRYLDQISRFLREWNNAGPGGMASKDLVISFMGRYSQGELSLVAETGISKVALEQSQHLFAFMFATLSGEQERAREMMEKQSRAHSVLLHEMRRDLGVQQGDLGEDSAPEIWVVRGGGS